MKGKVTFEELGEKEKEEAANIIEHIPCSDIKLTAGDSGMDRDSFYLRLLSNGEERHTFKRKCHSVLSK